MRKTHKHRKPELLHVHRNTLSELCMNCEGLCYRFAKTANYMLFHVNLHAFTPETPILETCSIANMHAFTPKTAIPVTCSIVAAKRRDRRSTPKSVRSSQVNVKKASEKRDNMTTQPNRSIRQNQVKHTVTTCNGSPRPPHTMWSQ